MKLKFQLRTPFLVITLTALLFSQPNPTPHSPVRNPGKPTRMTVHAGSHTSDDKDHCFQGDEKRNLYFDIATELPTGRAYIDLYDLGDFSTKPALVEQSDEKIDQGLATVVIKGHAVSSATVNTSTAHLGPGPYVAVASVATSTDKKDRLSTIAGISRYYYETFISDSSECSH